MLQTCESEDRLLRAARREGQAARADVWMVLLVLSLWAGLAVALATLSAVH